MEMWSMPGSIVVRKSRSYAKTFLAAPFTSLWSTRMARSATFDFRHEQARRLCLQKTYCAPVRACRCIEQSAGMNHQPVVGGIDEGQFAGGDIAVQDRLGQGIVQEVLHCPAQRARTIRWLVTTRDEEITCSIAYFQADALPSQALCSVVQHEPDNVLQMACLQRMKIDHLINAIK